MWHICMQLQANVAACSSRQVRIYAQMKMCEMSAEQNEEIVITVSASPT